MHKAGTYGLIGLSAVAVVATLDSAFGLGGGALLADICRTFLEDEPMAGGNGMGNMAMEVKPIPLIALSLGATGAAIFAMSREHSRALAGRSMPDDAERAAILGAMLIVASAQGRTTREELMDVFRIVTTHSIEDELVELAYERFGSLSKADTEHFRLVPVSSKIGRRRVLAASLLIGCVARPSSAEVPSTIEQIAIDIGATREDIAIARKALEDWQEGYAHSAGVSLITVLRHRALQLTPA